MKKFLILFFFVSAFTTSLKAQTAAETIEWLNAKVPVFCQLSEYYSFDKACVVCTNGGTRKIYWKEATSVVRQGANIVVTGTVRDENNKIRADKSIRMSRQIHVSDEDVDRCVKALEHLATLGGARIIKDDLF